MSESDQEQAFKTRTIWRVDYGGRDYVVTCATWDAARVCAWMAEEYFTDAEEYEATMVDFDTASSMRVPEAGAELEPDDPTLLDLAWDEPDERLPATLCTTEW